MALVVLLRGVNVGGHRTFRPSEVARALHRFGVVNIGAAGTFVVRLPGPRRQFRDVLRRALPIDTEIVFCDGREVLRLAREHPFGPAAPGVVRFVSFLTHSTRTRPIAPVALPDAENWLVRVVGATDRAVFGEYRRHMKTIGYLGQLERVYGVRATTRNWNTVGAIVRVLGDAAIIP